MNTPAHYQWVGDLREVTGLGGQQELAARAAVSAAAFFCDSLPSHAQALLFERDEAGHPRPITPEAADLDLRMRDAAGMFADLTPTEYVGVLRLVQRYWISEPGPDRWERFLAMRVIVEGTCRFCGEAIDDASLTNWLDRTRCMRCVASRKFQPMGGAKC